MFRPRTLLDRYFEFGILIKGVDGLLEILGGVLLFFINTSLITSFTSFLTRRELAEDPHDFVASHLFNLGHSIALSGTHYAAYYLLGHGFIKVLAVAGLLKNWLWAYPFSLATLLFFVIYQLHSLFVHFTIYLALFTVLDIAIIWLVWREYAVQRQRSQGRWL